MKSRRIPIGGFPGKFVRTCKIAKRIVASQSNKFIEGGRLNWEIDRVIAKAEPSAITIKKIRTDTERKTTLARLKVQNKVAGRST